MLPVLFGEGDLKYGGCPYFPFVFAFEDEMFVIPPVVKYEEVVFAPPLAFPAAKPVSPFIVFIFKGPGSRSSIEVKATKPAHPIFSAV